MVHLDGSSHYEALVHIAGLPDYEGQVAPSSSTEGNASQELPELEDISPDSSFADVNINEIDMSSIAEEQLVLSDDTATASEPMRSEDEAER